MSQPPRDTREAAQIAHLKQLLACLREVSHVLNRENELIPLCEQICESLARTLDYVSVWIGRPDAAGQRVEGAAKDPHRTRLLRHRHHQPLRRQAPTVDRCR